MLYSLYAPIWFQVKKTFEVITIRKRKDILLHLELLKNMILKYGYNSESNKGPFFTANDLISVTSCLYQRYKRKKTVNLKFRLMLQCWVEHQYSAGYTHSYMYLVLQCQPTSRQESSKSTLSLICSSLCGWMSLHYHWGSNANCCR